MKRERDSKNTSLHYRKPLPELPLIAVQSSLIMHCQGQKARDRKDIIKVCRKNSPIVV